MKFHADEEKHRRKFAGICRFAKTHGWKVEAVSREKSRARTLRGWIAKTNPIGCIVEGSLPQGSPRRELFGRLPVVWLDPPTPPGKRDAAVTCDNAAVARAAYRELSATLPPCYAAVPSHGMQGWSKDRIDAFQALCGENGAECRVFPAIRVRPGHAGDDLVRRRRRLAEWIATLPTGCAVFAANDYSAEDVAYAAQTAGKIIPRDLTLVGADGWGDDGRKGAHPEFSSIQLDFELAGFLAAKMLSAMAADAAGSRRPSPGHGDSTFGPLCVLRRESTRGRGRRDPFILQAVEIIRREATGGLTAAKLATMVPGSRHHFERRFREAMGHSVLDEIMHVRIQAAMTLLAKPELPIGAIADFSGFGSQVELRIIFRARTGMSLRQWRKYHLGRTDTPGAEGRI